MKYKLKFEKSLLKKIFHGEYHNEKMHGIFHKNTKTMGDYVHCFDIKTISSMLIFALF